MATEDNNRVTVAILKSEMTHLRETIDRYHQEVCEDIKDHEDRLRSLEGRRSWSVWADVGAYIAAIGAGIAGALSK
jgi:hypothetical protein